MKKLVLLLGVLTVSCSNSEQLESTADQLRRTGPRPEQLQPGALSENSLQSLKESQNCVNWGRITYRNTIKDIFERNCTSCHAPAYSGAPGFAASPKQPYFTTYAQASLNPGITRYYITSHNGAPAAMPPPQSQEAMNDVDLFRLDKWLDNTDKDYLIEGSALPNIKIKGAGYARDFLRISYEAADLDSPFAKVAFFLDPKYGDFDGEVFTGCHRLGKRTIQVGHAQLKEGLYYIYGCVFDKDNVTCNYYEDPVQIGRVRRPKNLEFGR